LAHVLHSSPISILEGWDRVLCQLFGREIASVDEGFGDFEGWEGLDMRILGCFEGTIWCGDCGESNSCVSF
jgi:hypothetical protein